MGLLDWITESAKSQYAKGAPYREAIGGLLQGDPTKFGLLAQEFNRKAQTPEGALDVALNVNPMLTFIGKGSKLWNSDLAKKAVELEKKGVAPEEIWRQTGTAKFADGKWRQEISDVGAKITDDVYEGIKKNKNFAGPLEKSMQHEQLYKAYPEVKDIYTTMYASPLPEGSFESASKTITVGGPSTGYQKSSALHEVQHGIQDIEGWARGGTPESAVGSGVTKENQFDWAKRAYENSIGKNGNISDEELLSQLLDKPYAHKNVKSWEDLSQREKLPWLDQGRQMAYRRLAGEAEARLTQRRMNLTPEQRLQYYPYNQGKEVYGLDVPYNELIIRGLLE